MRNTFRKHFRSFFFFFYAFIVQICTNHRFLYAVTKITAHPFSIYTYKTFSDQKKKNVCKYEYVTIQLPTRFVFESIISYMYIYAGPGFFKDLFSNQNGDMLRTHQGYVTVVGGQSYVESYLVYIIAVLL